MNKCLKCFLIFLLILLSLISFVLIVLGSLFTTTGLFSTNKCTPPKNIINYAHRGMTDKFQENTKDGELATILDNMGANLDISLTKDKQVILFSQTDPYKLTGELGVVISNSTLKELKGISYSSVIDNYHYEIPRNLSLLNDTVYDLCFQDPFHPINININFELNEENSKRIIEIMDKSPCQCDNSQHLIYTTPYFSQIPLFRKIANQGRCHGKIALTFMPNTYVMGEYFWLKTKFPIYYSNPDIVDAHYVLWQAHPEILKDLDGNGFCTSVSGGLNETLSDVDVNSYRVVDITKSTVPYVSVYIPDELAYKLYIALFVIGIAMLFPVIFLFCLLNRKEPPKTEKPKEINLANII
jgi:hypothetical protein